MSCSTDSKEELRTEDFDYSPTRCLSLNTTGSAGKAEVTTLVRRAAISARRSAGWKTGLPGSFAADLTAGITGRDCAKDPGCTPSRKEPPMDRAIALLLIVALTTCAKVDTRRLGSTRHPYTIAHELRFATGEDIAGLNTHLYNADTTVRVPVGIDRRVAYEDRCA